VLGGQGQVTLAWRCDHDRVAPLRGVTSGGGTAPPVVGVTVGPVQPAGQNQPQGAPA